MPRYKQKFYVVKEVHEFSSDQEVAEYLAKEKMNRAPGTPDPILIRGNALAFSIVTEPTVTIGGPRGGENGPTARRPGRPKGSKNRSTEAAQA